MLAAFGRLDLRVRSLRVLSSEGVTSLLNHGVKIEVLASFGLVVEHTRALVACVVVLGSPLSHLSLIVIIRSCE
jgi:hypothetical protein